MATRYHATAWYWLVGNRAAPDNIFSAPAGGYVAASDAGYAAFVAAGNAATAIPSDGELADVLTQAGAPGALVLAAAGSAPLWNEVPPEDVVAAVAAAGCALGSTAIPALDATYELSGTAWSDLTEEAQYIQSFAAFSGNPTPASLPWLTRSGTVSFTATAQLMAVARGLGDYLSGWKRWVAGGMTGDAPVFGSTTIA